MAFVQASSSSSASASGVAGPSLTGVAQGHGLVCFVLYNVSATAQTLSDSSGTTWALWRSIALTGSQIAVFRTTNLVAAGTHTITPSWTGGGGAWLSLIEDNQSPYAGGPVGKTLTAPGAGSTLVPGGVLGVANSSCHMLAVDTTNKAGGVPGVGAFDSNNWTTFDAGIGSWMLAQSTSLGGTYNPGMAPGFSDPTGADNYAVLGMAFTPGGTMVVDGPLQPVLFDEDFQRRADHSLGLQFRTPFLAPATPLAFLSTKTPPWEHYRDTFTSVYPLLQAFEQNTQVTPSPSPIIFYRPTNRLAPEEEELRRVDHQTYFRLQRFYVGQMEGYGVEYVDLNSDPWLEWVHPPASPEQALFPFRRIPVITPPGPNVILWGQPKPWWVAGEEDSVFRKPPSLEIIIPFPRPVPPTITIPNLVGLDVNTAIGIIQGLNLIFLQAVYQDVVYPIPAPNRFNPIGPEPPPPYGQVIGQWPLAGATVQPLLTQVTLTVSTGRSFISDVDTSSGNTPNTVIGSITGP